MGCLCNTQACCHPPRPPLSLIDERPEQNNTELSIWAFENGVSKLDNPEIVSSLKVNILLVI